MFNIEDADREYNVETYGFTEELQKKIFIYQQKQSMKTLVKT